MTGVQTCALPISDLLIYLKADVPTLIHQIHKRGREYEMNIDEDYLRRLNRKYNDWIDNYQGEVLVVDKNSEDFVEDASVFERICTCVNERETKLAGYNPSLF